MKQVASFLLLVLLSGVASAQSRSIINGSFEDPIVPAHSFAYFGAQNDNLHPQVPGWNSTNGTYAGLKHPMEIWSSGYSGISAAAGQGNQFVEINCSENARLYQFVNLLHGEKINWSFYHRGRAGIDHAEINIYDQTGSTKVQVLQSVATNQVWTNYTGSDFFNGASGVYQISFEAISTSTENPLVGNFLDGVEISFDPILEFSKSSFKDLEHAGGNVPKVRVNGKVPFGGMLINLSVDNSTANAGTEFTMLGALYVPQGDYDGSDASALMVPLTISDDTLVESDETITISIIGITAGGQQLDANFDGNNIHTAVYTIENDDYCILPEIYTNNSLPFCEGDTISLNVRMANYVQWSTGSSEHTIYISEPGKYSVTSYDRGCDMKNSIDIASIVCGCTVVVPSAFSPNGDGVNDLFRPLSPNKCRMDFMELEVFDRWGDLVFKSVDIYTPWDGKILNGDPAPLGVYVWNLGYKIHRDDNQPVSGFMTGNVTLLR